MICRFLQKSFVKSLTTLSIHMAFAAGLIVITLALGLALTIVQPQSCLIMAWYVLPGNARASNTFQRLGRKLTNTHTILKRLI